MSDLDKAIHEASQAGRDHAKEAGRAVGQALEAYNNRIKERNNKHFDDEIRAITKYHEDRVMKNKTYHF